MSTPEWPAIEPLTDHIPAWSTDISSLLPRDWQQQIREASSAHSAFQTLSGGSSTSRESAFTSEAVPRVGVLTGDTVAHKLSWLDGLYRGALLDIVNARTGIEYEPSSDIRSGININTTLEGSRYEWHVDSNPITALLFVTSHALEDGGQLVFRPDPIARPTEEWEVSVRPQAGVLLIFDAREAAHVVTEVLRGTRISVPMNYYERGTLDRPSDLDEYLYE